jgi:hypothetical protein
MKIHNFGEKTPLQNYSRDARELLFTKRMCEEFSFIFGLGLIFAKPSDKNQEN